MENPILYIPVGTTVFSIVVAWFVFARWRTKRSPHLAWWGVGIVFFGLGTFAEGWVAVAGWSEGMFRYWYIVGALLGAWPLAQGNVYLLASRRVANTTTAIIVPFIILASVFVILTPVDGALAEEHRLSPEVIEWSGIRGFSPVVNTYSFIALVGGAIYSARLFRGDPALRGRYHGAVLIAIGGVLPGIGGIATRAGATEVLYVTEFVGLAFIFAGFLASTRGRQVAAQAPLPALGERGLGPS